MSTPARRQAQVDPWQDPNAEPILRIEGVTKTFGKTYAVDDVSLDIFRGEFFALLGGSGCGKSTLLRILGWKTPPSSWRRRARSARSSSASRPGPPTLGRRARCWPT